MNKETVVSSIKAGTVIDHIPADKTFKVADILSMEDVENIISVAVNLRSEKMEKKGIIKVGGKFLNSEEVSKIALLAPDVTMSIIKDFKVIEKVKLKIPNEIKGIVKCSNPNCITNHEETQRTFHVVQKEPLNLKCHYCERLMVEKDIVLL